MVSGGSIGEGVTGVAQGYLLFVAAHFYYCALVVFDVYMTGNRIHRFANMEFMLFNCAHHHAKRNLSESTYPQIAGVNNKYHLHASSKPAGFSMRSIST
jgi:hypothetical protein